MAKIFSPLNILTVAVIAGVIYLGYLEFYSQDQGSANIGKNRNNIAKEANKETDTSKETSDVSSDYGQEEDHQTPVPQAVSQQQEVPVFPEWQDVEMEQEKGAYKNLEYGYEVTFPREWPLRITKKEKVALGYDPPQDGTGVIKIKAGEDMEKKTQDTIEQAQEKEEVEVEERSARVDNTLATKYIVHTADNKKDFYVVAEKYDIDYVFEYSNESSLFVNKAERVIYNFKFIQ